MKKTYIYRENIVGTNSFWTHNNEIFSNKKCDVKCYEIRDEDDLNNRIMTDKFKKPLPSNNSWVRNAHQYKTKAGGATSQVNFDHVIAVWSEAYHARVSKPKQFIPKEPPIHLDYKYWTYEVPTSRKSITRTTKSLYRRRSHKATDTNLPKKYK